MSALNIRLLVVNCNVIIFTGADCKVRNRVNFELPGESKHSNTKLNVMSPSLARKKLSQQPKAYPATTD